MIGDVVEYNGEVGVLCQFLGTDVGSVRVVIRIKDNYVLASINDIKKTDKPLEPIKPPTKKKKKKSRKVQKALT